MFLAYPFTDPPAERRLQMRRGIVPPGVARRVGYRLACFRHGHTWKHARVTLGDTQLVRTECRRCGTIGTVESARQDGHPEVS
jgi:hypothetical protein